MPHIEVRRRMAEEDIAGIATLLRVVELADGHAPLGEHNWLDLVQGGRLGFAGFIAREPGHERVIGYAQLSQGPSSWAVEFAVHPSFRGLGESVERALLEAALGELARSGGGHVHLWVARPSAVHDAVAESVGLRRGRDLYQMRRTLPLEDSLRQPLVETRPFRVGVDEEAWLAVNNAAFGDHPEQGSWTIETLKERERQPWFSPEGFLLHERDGVLAAFCWTKVHDEDPPIGEIYVIAVDPVFAGQGLGRSLLIAGLTHMESLGLTAAMLYVDAANEAALGLYRAFGFVLNHVDRAYVADVAPLS